MVVHLPGCAIARAFPSFTGHDHCTWVAIGYFGHGYFTLYGNPYYTLFLLVPPRFAISPKRGGVLLGILTYQYKNIHTLNPWESPVWWFTWLMCRKILLAQLNKAWIMSGSILDGLFIKRSTLINFWWLKSLSWNPIKVIKIISLQFSLRLTEQRFFFLGGGIHSTVDCVLSFLEISIRFCFSSCSLNKGWFTCSRPPIRIRCPINGLIFKKTIFLVIILILKHALFRLMQKYPSLVINCLLCCMNCCYSWGVIRKSHRIYTCSHRIKFYNYTLRMRSDGVLSFTGALLTKTVTKK